MHTFAQHACLVNHDGVGQGEVISKSAVAVIEEGSAVDEVAWQQDLMLMMLS